MFDSLINKALFQTNGMIHCWEKAKDVVFIKILARRDMDEITAVILTLCFVYVKGELEFMNNLNFVIHKQKISSDHRI